MPDRHREHTARGRFAEPDLDETPGPGGEEGGEVALLGDGEPVDEVDAIEERRAPGEPPSGLPADEVLRVHPLTASEPAADRLDVAGDDLELSVPDEDEPLEEEDPQQVLDRALHPTILARDLEVRYEELDPEIE